MLSDNQRSCLLTVTLFSGGPRCENTFSREEPVDKRGCKTGAVARPSTGYAGKNSSLTLTGTSASNVLNGVKVSALKPKFIAEELEGRLLLGATLSTSVFTLSGCGCLDHVVVLK